MVDGNMAYELASHCLSVKLIEKTNCFCYSKLIVLRNLIVSNTCYQCLKPKN